MNRRRAIGAGLASLATAAVAARVASVDGLARPILVSGPSMSPTLWGPSLRACCEDCRWRWRVHYRADLQSLPLRCFRCGRLGVQWPEPTAAGDPVWIDRASYWAASPRRDDLVAIAKEAGGMEVKRVVGLPGETVAIGERGEILVDGARKADSPARAWARSVVVYDDRPRDSRWRRSDDSGWLLYHHVDIHSNGRPDVVRDDDPANLGARRRTRAVWDFRLALRVETATGCDLRLALWHRDHAICGSAPITPGDPSMRIGNTGEHLWRIATGESIEPRASFADMPAELGPHAPVAIRLHGDPRARIRSLWLGRGVRYDPPPAMEAAWRAGIRVAPDHVVVFGDNPPASHDSRMTGAGVPSKRILGRVLKARW